MKVHPPFSNTTSSGKTEIDAGQLIEEPGVRDAYERMSDHIDAVVLKRRHDELHRALDELLACYLVETGRRPSETTLMELVAWSNEMTKEPVCQRHLAKRKKW